MTTETGRLLQTKLHRPRLTRDLVPRPRLLEQLSKSLDNPLTLICAPAGFGKTTLVSDWIQSLTPGAEGSASAVSTAWLSLDESDSDLLVFLRYFVSALRTHFPGAGAEILRLLYGPQVTATDVLAITLSNELAVLPGSFIMVLDDYHSLQGEAVHALFNELVRHWPAPLHLVLISRHNPPLPLARLRAQGVLNEIRSSELRFIQEETNAYLSRVLELPLSRPEIALLVQRAEGWIGGLQLAALSLQHWGSAGSIRAALSNSDILLADYLVDEVLLQQLPAIQVFLLRTAILDRFCASLCEAVVGEVDPAWSVRACMDWIERANLFIVPLDDHRQWYRFHQLFRDLLRQRLAVGPEAQQVTTLHRRAAAWFAQHGLLEEALRHLLEIKDFDQAASLLEQGLCEVLNRQDRPTLERWLRLLPEALIESRPGLLMIKVWAFQFSWQLGARARTIQQVEALLAADSEAARLENDPLQLRAQLFALAGLTAFLANQHAHAIACSQEALARLPASWAYVRGGAMFVLGRSLQSSGHGQQAESLLLDAYEALTNKNGVFASQILFAHCYNQLSAAELERAWQTASLVLQQADSSELPILRSWAHYFLALIAYQWDDLATAAHHFSEVVAHRYTSQIAVVYDSLAGLALIHQLRGEPSQAAQLVELLSQIDLEQRGYEDERTRSIRARLMLLQGDLESAARWADTFTLSPPDLPLLWFEEPQVTRVRVLLAKGTPAGVQDALNVLEVLCEIAGRTYNTHAMIEIQALRAMAFEAQGRRSQAQAALRQAVGLSAPGGYIRVFVDLGAPMQALLSGLEPADEPVGRILAAFPEIAYAGVSRASRVQRVPSAVKTADPLPVANASTLPATEFQPMVEHLTRRELEVLTLLREPLSTKDIAKKLGISYPTVKRHTINLYGKFGVSSRWDAVARAISLGILPQNGSHLDSGHPKDASLDTSFG